MKKEFEDYLKNIFLSDTMIRRIDELIDLYNAFYPEEIEDIFIEETMENGERQYLGVYLFSKNYLVEIPQFLEGKTIRVFPIKHNVNLIEIERDEFDFKNSTSASRMEIMFGLSLAVQGTLHASATNCKYLTEIVQKYIVPNLYCRDTKQ